MKTTKKGRWLVLLAAMAAAGAVDTQATCVFLNQANYQIGQTALVTAYNDLPADYVVRRGEAVGEGLPLLRCTAGAQRFFGSYVKPTVGGLVPLTVGGKPSGFGVRVTIQEHPGEVTRPFPYEFTDVFTAETFVTSADDKVGYEVVRMTGPVVFGPIDTEVIARGSFDIGGAAQVFREMKIYELTLVRPSCSITAESINQTVPVGDFNLSNFATPDRATPWQKFNLTVGECLEPVGMVAQFTFGTDADRDPDLPTIFSMADSGSRNVGLEIGDEDEKTIEPGKPLRLNALGTGKDFVFKARLRETRFAVVGGGTFVRPVKVQVDFF